VTGRMRACATYCGPAPEDLAGVAEVFCDQSDPEGQFLLGLDLMLRRLGDSGA